MTPPARTRHKRSWACDNQTCDNQTLPPPKLPAGRPAFKGVRKIRNWPAGLGLEPGKPIYPRHFPAELMASKTRSMPLL